MKKSDINKVYAIIKMFVQECPDSSAVPFIQRDFESWLRSKEGEIDREIDSLKIAAYEYTCFSERSGTFDTFHEYIDNRIQGLKGDVE